MCCNVACIIDYRERCYFLKPEEGCGNNRSVMPLDVPGCTRATMIIAVSISFKCIHVMYVYTACVRTYIKMRNLCAR